MVIGPITVVIIMLCRQHRCMMVKVWNSFHVISLFYIEIFFIVNERFFFIQIVLDIKQWQSEYFDRKISLVFNFASLKV